MATTLVFRTKESFNFNAGGFLAARSFFGQAQYERANNHHFP